MKILIIETGGTISGCVPEYEEIPKMSAIYSQEIDLPHYISEILQYTTHSNITLKVVANKDSREINEQDRNSIVNAIKKYPNIDKILITHGTYTMPETGTYILENLTAEEVAKKSIMITGSMYPWIIAKSDAPANIGASLQALSSNIKGVHICMHQRLFDPRKVKKDAENLLFKDSE
jgi:L-asparaginase